MINKKAFLFDLNGTMIDDMSYHIRAWHRILNELGANLSMERMKEECYGRNQELLERIFPARFSEEEKVQMIFEKEKQYQQEFKPHLQLLPGLHSFLEKAHTAGIKMAIGSAAIMFNIDFVLDNLNIRHYFDAIISADDVSKSKPDPETFIKCAERLHVAPGDCIVFEDAPKGVESSLNAGMQSVVLTTMHIEEDFKQYPNTIAFVKDFSGTRLDFLFE
jgi:beta-phosphoglucomutase